jgi:hypothetical protein
MRDYKFFLGELNMNNMKLTLTTLAAFLLIMTSAAATQATVLRAFVSSTGADANTATNCAQSAPCKTFNAAIAVVTPGGELIALDTSGYGPITSINKAITIATVPGAEAFVVAPAGTAAFTINGGTSDLIKLRNINFNGSGAASTTGILHNSGNLVIENSEFTQLTTGLRGLAGSIIVRQSSFTANSSRGVHASGTAKVELLNCTITNNGTGITADGNGGCPNDASPIPAVMFVRLAHGSVVSNTLGFEMLNTVQICSGFQNGQNIFISRFGGTVDFLTVNIIDNTTTVSVNPLSAPSLSTNSLGTYRSIITQDVP